ncbi:hypothetical protein ERAQ111492_00490 [Erysipelothrix aquatica]
MKLLVTLKNISLSTRTILNSDFIPVMTVISALDNIINYVWVTNSYEILREYIGRLFDFPKRNNEKFTLFSKQEDLYLDSPNQTLIKNDILHTMTPTEMKIISLFLSRKGVIFTRSVIVDSIEKEPMSVLYERNVR